MANFYVAGKWGDSESISKKIQSIEDLGFGITLNWTKLKEECSKEEQMIGDDTLPNHSKNPKKHRISLGNDAKKEIEGIKKADAVIAIMDDEDYTYRGTFTEIGAALGLDKKIFIYNPHKESRCMTNCFYWHDNIKHYNNWDELLNMLNIEEFWEECVKEMDE